MTTQTREVLQQLTAARDRDYIIAKLKRTQGELNDAVDQALILLDLPHGTWIKYCFYTEAKDGIAWQCSQCGGFAYDPQANVTHRYCQRCGVKMDIGDEYHAEETSI